MKKQLSLVLFFVYFLASHQPAKAGDDKEKISSLRGNGMMFTENKGQIVDMNQQLRPDILFKADGGRASTYLRKTGISYVFSNIGDIMGGVEVAMEELQKQGKFTRGTIEEQTAKQELYEKQTLNLHRIDVDFVNCLPLQQIIKTDQVEGENNYYYAHCPQGITQVYSYNQVTVKNIYNNIDVKYYGGKSQGLKYDIVVNPGGNPNEIQLKYNGVNGMYIQHGKLYIKTSMGELEESLPKVYQTINGQTVDVKAEYVLSLSPSGRAGEGLVSFKLSSYNFKYPLIIDPWVTYYGGSGNDCGGPVATDNSGNVIVAGQTTSTNFPITAGAVQIALGGTASLANSIGGDISLVKFTENGTREFATYFGGTGAEIANDITTDLSDNIIMTGMTSSANFPTLNPGGGAYYQSSMGASLNPFIIKFTSTGSLTWSTYYGGTSSSVAYGVATDASNSIFITGIAYSTSFPVQAAYQPASAGSVDAFVLKFNSGGVRQWATFYGGSGADYGRGIECDVVGNVFVCGYTNSANFPVLAAHQAAGGGTTGTNGFLFKLTGTTGFPVWSTYYGGYNASFNDQFYDLKVDGAGDVIATGWVASAINMVSAGAYQTTIGGGINDGFVVKFSNAGVRKWGTYLGGSNEEYVTNLALDAANNIYILGEWEEMDAGNYPISSCAYQPNYGGVEDQFIAKYKPTGEQSCITYLGGANEDDLDFVGGIAINGNSVYISGFTAGNYPVTPGAFQTVYAGIIGQGNGDAFIAQLCTNICEAKVLGLNYAASTTTTCVNTPVTYTSTVNNSCDTTGYKFQWSFPGGTPSSSTALNPIVTYYSPGSYAVKLVLTTVCKKDSVINSSYITINPCGCTLSAQAATVSNLTCNGTNNGSASATISSGSGAYTYSWSNGVSSITNSSTHQINNLAPGTYTVTITDGSCVVVSTTSIAQGLQLTSVSSTGLTCNAGSNGSATVTISGTGGPYTYSWSNGSSSITSSTTSQISNLTAQTYSVTVTENSCILTSTVVITAPQAMAIGGYPKWSCISNSVTASVGAGLGTPPYNYLWSTGQTTSIVTGLSPGTYSVTVTDNLGCTASTAMVGAISPPPVITSSSSTNISCASVGMASVITSGIPPITYSWSSGQTASALNGIPAGGYTVTVTDDNGCIVTKSFTITGSSTLSASFTQSPSGTICAGTTVNFTYTGTAATIYRWFVNGSILQNSGNSNFSYTFTSPGQYFITDIVLKFAPSCQASANSIVNVINCTAPTVTAAPASICSGSCAAITATGSGGNTPYTYLWSTGATTQSINPCPIINTNYIVTITDAASATSTTSALVTVSTGINATATATSNINCNGAANGSASVTITSGGGGPYTYSWSNGTSGTTSATTIPVTNLSAATYTVTITEGSCTTTSITTITQPTALSFAAPAITNATCGVNNGSASVAAAGGSGSLNYVWSNSATGQTISGVAAGTYIVTVTDGNSCTKTVAALINNSPSPTINSVTTTSVTCNGNTNGSAVASATGGSGTLTYSWSNGNSGITGSSLSAGTYVITVTDASGCLAQSNVIIAQPSAVTATTTITANVNCNGNNNGSANVTGSGGTPNYTYSWSSGHTSQTTTGISAGNYTVTVRDANNCSTISTVMITEPTLVNATTSVSGNTSCNGTSDGSANAIGSGGTGSMTYSWNNTSTSQTISSLTAGTYTVTVRDANNCSAISTVAITEPPALSLGVPTTTTATCGNSNGSVSVIAAGGSGSLVYSWSNAASGQTIVNLPAGGYTVTVTDANACTIVTSAFVNNNPSATIGVTINNVSCNGNSNGSAVASATGGSGTLTYAWSNGNSGITGSSLSAGTYIITVTDASGCLTQSNVTITQPPAISTPTITTTNATCGSANGSALANSSGGTGTLTYMWSNGYTGTTNTNLSANTYTITVQDANSCSSITTTVINNTNGPSVLNVAAVDVQCNGNNTGSALVDITGGTIPYSYEWSAMAGSGTIFSTTIFLSNVSVGTYTVTITDATNCTITTAATITEPPAISVNTPSVTNATCGNNNGTLTLTTPTGGTGAYTYSWSNGVTTQNVSSLTSATYSVTITDNNGCTKTTSATVNNTTGGTVALSVASTINCNGGTGSVLATATASTSPYTYSWSNGASTTTSSLQHTVGSLQSSTYTVTVTDNNGCTATSTLNLTEPTAITFTSINSYTTSCGTNNGGADVTATGGTGALNYSWSTTASGQTITNQSAGTYIVTITDANSCTSTTSVLINNNPSATINSVTTTTLSCNNSSDGAAVINASGGVGTLTYSWSNAVSGQTISNVNAGTYIVSVTDGSGCLIQSNVVITEPTTVSAQNTNAISSTCGNNNGSADIIATGGTGSYTYNWSTGASSVTSGQSAIGSLQSSTYYCTVTDQNNCSYVHTFVIGNKPSPVFTGSSPTVTAADCKGNNTGQIDVLISSGTAPYTYSWSSGVSTITIAQNNTLNNLPAGNYSLTITDNNGCSVDTSLTLTEPTFVFTSTVTTTNATCITGGTATATINGGNTGNYTYSWSNGTSSVSNSQLAVGNNLPANNYTLTVTDSKGCTTVSTTTINAPALPTVTATEQTAATCNSNNGVAVATGSGGSGSNYTYSWSNNAAGLTANNLSANNYTVTITDGNGCTSTSTATITNSNGPSVSLQSSTGTCIGQSNGQASITITGGTGPYTYSWNNGANSTTSSLNHFITSLLANSYTVTITDNNNCTITTAITVTQFPNPTANAGTDQTITSGTSIQLTASGGTSYLWTPSATLNNAGISNPIANPTQTTTYTVTVTDANSCSSTDDITVTVTTPQTCTASEADEFVANVFTPNGDGKNDILNVKGFGLTNMYFAIYNRWGQKLFETTDQTKGWDGTQNGKPIDEQTVVYYLTATCVTTGANIVKKGDVSVVR